MTLDLWESQREFLGGRRNIGRCLGEMEKQHGETGQKTGSGMAYHIIISHNNNLLLVNMVFFRVDSKMDLRVFILKTSYSFKMKQYYKFLKHYHFLLKVLIFFYS